jgi:UDP-N-acetylglucosamine diphosphorylase/glucosamine-1-phosphate N-acetyltransferase
MALYLFDDAQARSWTPFATTRPAGELLFGCLLLRERAERFWNTPSTGQLVNSALGGFDEAGAPPVLDGIPAAGDEPLVFFSSRAVPNLDPAPSTDAPATLVIDGKTVGWIVPSGTPSPSESEILNPDQSTGETPVVEIGGRVLQAPWELISGTGEQICQDVSAIFPESRFSLPDGVHCAGSKKISVGHGVHLEAGVHLDATDGPIRLSDDVQVLAFTRLAGPAFVGPGTHLLGGAFQDVSIGPNCRVRGEVASSVVLGYSNKAHDGYLGHSYLGKWVNLGALTTSSDLKNNYGTVRVPTADGLVDTGLLKIGCMIGDHAKTGIGTLLSTGSVVGAGSNLFGGLMPPRYVPPFTWGSGDTLEEYDLERFLEVAERTMGRRDVSLTDQARTLLIQAWETTRSDRS